MNRSLVARVCAAVLFLALAAVVNLPYQFVPRNTPTLREADFELTASLADMANPVIAGWPAKYMIRHEFADGFRHTSWSFTAASINLALAASLFAAGAWYWRQNHKRRQAGGGMMKRRFALSDLLVLVVLAAIPFACWQRQKSLQALDARADRQLSDVGSVKRQTYVPKLLTEYKCPAWMIRNWSRVTCVDIHRPTDETVQLLVQQPYLRSIRLGGGDYSLDAIRYLPSMRFLQDLRIAGRALDDSAVRAIAACPLVSSLNVSRTNCNAEALAAFSRMPRLEKLMACDTSIPSQAWSDTACSEKLTDLIISRPDSGSAGSLQLDGWQRLRTLALRSFDQYFNPSPFDVRVANMPQLRELTIDALQRVSLDVSDAPRLKTLSREHVNSTRRVAHDERLPVKLWLIRGKLRNLPELEDFQFYTEDFESLEIDGCDSLNMVKASSQYLHGGLESAYFHNQDRATTQRLIDALGQLQGVNYLGIWGQPLQEVDLRPLSNNRDVNVVDLRGSQIAKDSLRQLAGIKWLKTIGLADVESDPSVVESINDQYAELEHARLDPTSLSIHFENKPNLTKVRFDKHLKSTIMQLRLVDVPKLTSPMIVCELGSECQVSNAPMMKGLAVLNPGARISVSNVGGLKWFVAGGPQLTDEVVHEVLAASGLERLTLAYGSASRPAYEQLLNLKSLKELILPGAAIDDDFVSRWTIPQSLAKLNLEGVTLSAASIKKIIDRGNWSELRLDGSEFGSETLASLAESPYLLQLSLAGATIDLAAMNSIASLTELTHLNLTRSTLPAGSLALLDSGRLVELDLNGASFDSMDLATLAKNNKMLRFRLNPADVSVPVMTGLLAQKRVHDPDDWTIRFQQMMPVQVGWDPTGRAVYEDPDDRDSGPEFKCPKLELQWPKMIAQANPSTLPAIAPVTPAKFLLQTNSDESNGDQD